MQITENTGKVKAFTKRELLKWVDALAAYHTIDRMVLRVLAKRSNRDGVSWPRFSQLVADTAAGERTVRRAIKRLIESGAISQAFRYAKSGRRTSNLYRLNVGSECLFKPNKTKITTGQTDRKLQKITTGHFGGDHFVDNYSSSILPRKNLSSGRYNNRSRGLDSVAGPTAHTDSFTLQAWSVDEEIPS